MRDAIAKGALPGPRILTSAEPLTGRGEQSGTPDEIRAYIRKQKEAGADLIKIFAAASIRRPQMTLSQEQLNAACDEAKKVGLRTLVHAYKDAVRAAALAGCTQVEHGVFATDDDLEFLVEKGVFLDPQAGLVMENYLLNKEKFAGTPFFPEEAFPAIRELIPLYRDFMKRAAKVPELRSFSDLTRWPVHTGETRRSLSNACSMRALIRWQRWFPPIRWEQKLSAWAT